MIDRKTVKPKQSLGSRRIVLAFGLVAIVAGLSFWPPQRGKAEPAVAAPAPLVDIRGQKSGLATAVLAGGCFWGVQGVYQHVQGVTKVVSGYAGGARETADYQTVSGGRSGHAEAVEITYDPSLISYGTLLQIYFSVAHDPTQVDRQGPDVGSQYRSAIFIRDAEQKRVASAYIAQLDKAGVFTAPIATKISPLTAFYPAERYHQDYATLHPNNPYIAYNDLPKIANLAKVFPALYRAEPKLLLAAAPN